MSQNIFEELQNKKQKLIALAQKASEYGWIPESKSDGKNIISLEEINNDTLILYLTH